MHFLSYGGKEESQWVILCRKNRKIPFLFRPLQPFLLLCFSSTGFRVLGRDWMPSEAVHQRGKWVSASMPNEAAIIPKMNGVLFAFPKNVLLLNLGRERLAAILSSLCDNASLTKPETKRIANEARNGTTDGAFEMHRKVRCVEPEDMRERH